MGIDLQEAKITQFSGINVISSINSNSRDNKPKTKKQFVIVDFNLLEPDKDAEFYSSDRDLQSKYTADEYIYKNKILLLKKSMKNYKNPTPKY